MTSSAWMNMCSLFVTSCYVYCRPGKGAEYFDQLFCLSVCLSVCTHFSWTIITSKLIFCAHCGRRLAALCVLNDVYNELSLLALSHQRQHRAGPGVEFDVYDCLALRALTCQIVWIDGVYRERVCIDTKVVLVGVHHNHNNIKHYYTTTTNCNCGTLLPNKPVTLKG